MDGEARDGSQYRSLLRSGAVCVSASRRCRNRHLWRRHSASVKRSSMHFFELSSCCISLYSRVISRVHWSISITRSQSDRAVAIQHMSFLARIYCIELAKRAQRSGMSALPRDGCALIVGVLKWLSGIYTGVMETSPVSGKCLTWLSAAPAAAGIRYTKYRFNVSITDKKPVLISEYCFPPVTCDFQLF